MTSTSERSQTQSGQKAEPAMRCLTPTNTFLQSTLSPQGRS
nr:MAG TPA: hypothetical protein [Bacteriophage sp.]